MEPKKMNTATTNLIGEVIKVDEKEGKEGRYFITLLLVPAPTTKDYPKQFPIFSNSRIGPVGTDINVMCELRSRKNGSFHNLSLSHIPSGQ